MTVGATDACKRNLSLPVRVGMPSEVKGLVDDILNPAFAAPIGLLLQGFSNSPEKTSNVFLPKFGEISRKIQIKGVFGKIGSFIKSFLP